MMGMMPQSHKQINKRTSHCSWLRAAAAAAVTMAAATPEGAGSVHRDNRSEAGLFASVCFSLGKIPD